MTPKQFRNMFLVLANVDRWTLEEAGIIPVGRHADDKWTRFNSDLTTFVLKLNDEQLEALLAIAIPRNEKP